MSTVPVVRPTLSCRFYEEKFPELHEAVNTNVTEIGEMGAYVKLLEYNNVPGMILLSELSRRRIRSINKLVRVGRDECAVVVRVDRDKGYIDLSKRRLSDDEKKRCENKFEKAKHVNSIVKHTADVLGMQTNEELEDFMSKTAWALDRIYKKPEEAYKASYDCFKKAVDDPAILDQLDISDEQKDILLKTIRQRLTPQAEKLRAEIEVTCFNYEGVDAIKAALRKGMECSTEAVPIKINLYAPPTYFMTTLTNDKNMGFEVLNNAMDLIKAEIESKGGSFDIRKAPHIDELPADVVPPPDPAGDHESEGSEEDEE
jgi:translation initiation factor 2 subunit 1